MSTEMSSREKRIAEWWFQNMLGHAGQLPQGNYMLVYMQTLMDLAAADGVFDDGERKWILGFASVCGKTNIAIQILYVISYNVGLHEDLVDQLGKYEPGTSQEVNNLFNDADKPYVQASRFGMIFYAFRAASADGELHPKEAEAIYSVGKKLGISDEKLAEIHALSDEEETLRQKRALTLYPQGLDESMVQFENKFS